MAIIFVSIRKKQRIFFWGISILLAVTLAAISFLVVAPELRNTADVVVQEVFSAPDINIRFDIIDSAQVKNLEPFSPDFFQGFAAAGKANPFLPAPTNNIIKK